MNKENFKAYIAWITVCIVWGTTYLAIRIGVTELPPMLFAGLRWILAGSILFTFLKLRNYKLPNKRDMLHSGIIGLLLLGFGNGLVVTAEQWLPSGLTALFLTTIPFWIVGIESFLPNGTKINGRIIIGLLLGLSGIALIFGSDFQYIFNSEYKWGVVSILFAVIIWANGALYSKYKKLSIHPLMSASIQMLVAGILQTILGSFLGEFSRLHFQTNSFLAFIYLVFIGSFLGYTSFIYAISHLPVSLVSTYAYINPVIALFLGWLVLDEKFDLKIIIASIVILIGVALVKTGTDKKKKDNELKTANNSVIKKGIE